MINLILELAIKILNIIMDPIRLKAKRDLQIKAEREKAALALKENNVVYLSSDMAKLMRESKRSDHP